MSSILKYAGKYRRHIFTALALISISVPIGVIPYFLISSLIGGYINETAVMADVVRTSVLILLCFTVKYILYGEGLNLSHEGAFGTLYNMRVKLADNLMHQPLGEVADGGTGKYKKSFVEEIGRIELMLAHMLPEGIPNLVMPFIVLAVIFVTDWRMGLLSLASLPFGIIGMGLMMKSGVKKMPLYYEAGARLNNAVVEYVSGMEVIKIFGQTTSSFKKYSDTVENYKVFTLDWFKESWRSMSLVYAGMPCTVLLTLPVGAIMYYNGNLDLNTWIFVLMLDLSMSGPLTRVINFFPMFPQVDYTVKQLEALYSTEDVHSGNVSEMPESFDVEFKNVTFAYKDKDVLKNVSFKAEQGKKTALVGESGSGKSTAARLAVHYWDVSDGSITIGGRDIREYTFDTLMSMTAYVAQDNFLFKGTIADNLRMGKKDATIAEMIEAAKAAACHDFISKLPHGYDTEVGVLGGKLSGGERQRITIARAILKNAPIIILDEATAYTDAENEELITNALNELTKGRTVIMIAHRLGTIADADNIVVLDSGRVSANGTHDELMESSSIYRRLWQMSLEAGSWNIAVKEGAENVSVHKENNGAFGRVPQKA